MDKLATTTPTALDLLNSEHVDDLFRLAELFSKSTLIPEPFQNKPEDVFVVLQLAIRYRDKINPLTFLQHCYVVNRRPGISAQLAHSMLDASGVTTGPPDIQYTGSEGQPDRTCIVTVTDSATGRAISHKLDLATVQRQGWLKAEHSPWKKDSEQMLAYRTLHQLIRRFYPGVLLGLYTKEELEEMGPAGPQGQTVVQAAPSRTQAVAQAVATPKGIPGPSQAEGPQNGDQAVQDADPDSGQTADDSPADPQADQQQFDKRTKIGKFRARLEDMQPGERSQYWQRLQKEGGLTDLELDRFRAVYREVQGIQWEGA